MEREPLRTVGADEMFPEPKGMVDQKEVSKNTHQEMLENYYQFAWEI